MSPKPNMGVSKQNGAVLTINVHKIKRSTDVSQDSVNHKIC